MSYEFWFRKKHKSDIHSLKEISVDKFFSAYNESERVQKVFAGVEAKEKYWVVLPEYRYEEMELTNMPNCTKSFKYCNLEQDEGALIKNLLGDINFSNKEEIAFDITGMLRAYVVFLVRYLFEKKARNITFIYSEPLNYVKKEHTEFSLNYTKIREVVGCAGEHNPETNKDVLVIGSGYDHLRMNRVAKAKKEARKVQLLGFPSLQADMFQQNILRSSKSYEEAFSGEFSLNSSNVILAPANNPFSTAQKLHDFTEREFQKNPFTNLYLCPLSTKAQVLGIALYYVFECIGKPVSIILPFSNHYSRETSKGISQLWSFNIDFSKTPF